MDKGLKHFNKVEDYFNKVDVYSKICKNNYMFHKEIFDIFKTFIENKFKSKPFSLLDIGCGDAFFIAQVLKDTNIKLYDAYDLSVEAIGAAKSNLKDINCKKNFIMADISKDFLNSSNGTVHYDVIWTSYALHHLCLNDKVRFFDCCKKNLKENSCLIIVDFVDDYNSREECLKHYKENVEKKWTELSKQDKQYLHEHVFKFDFPESFSKYKEIATELGFKKVDKLFQQDSWAYMLFTT